MMDLTTWQRFPNDCVAMQCFDIQMLPISLIGSVVSQRARKRFVRPIKTIAAPSFRKRGPPDRWVAMLVLWHDGGAPLGHRLRYACPFEDSKSACIQFGATH